MKYLILPLLALFFLQSALCQTFNDKSTMKEDKIKLEKATVEQDSALATHPLICSLSEDNKNSGLTKSEFQESNGKYSIDFYLQPSKGVFYVQLEGFPNDPKTELYLSNKKGDVIFETRAKTRFNQINMTKLPPGTYLLTVDVDEEISTWEIVKE